MILINVLSLYKRNNNHCTEHNLTVDSAFTWRRKSAIYWRTAPKHRRGLPEGGVRWSTRSVGVREADQSVDLSNRWESEGAKGVDATVGRSVGRRKEGLAFGSEEKTAIYGSGKKHRTCRLGRAGVSEIDR